MRKLPRLYLALLRYRVAAMVMLFMLIGAAHERVLDLAAAHAFAAAALASSYVAATALNDLADEDIDRINHPRDAGRPLVEGTATRRELALLHVAAAALALLAAVPLGWPGVALVVVALAVSQVYSARPLRLSYRIAGTPVALAVAYVLVPFALGTVACGADITSAMAPVTAALFCLFVARIVLKDFRDREGDALYGKPTILLRFGKTATCAFSAAFLALGDLLLALSLDSVLVLLVQPLVLAIGWMLWTLWRTTEPRLEQVAIGIGARLGNGILICILAWQVVSEDGASVMEATTIGGTIVALFLVSSLALAARADEVVIGYKG